MHTKFTSWLEVLPAALVILSILTYPVLCVASISLGGSRTERVVDSYYLIGKDTHELPDGRFTSYKTRRKISKAVYERARFLYALPSFGVMLIAVAVAFGWVLDKVFKNACSNQKPVRR